jgi:anti-anti-sigma regulatory factor
MFRITCADETATRVLRLEGWLTEERLPLLEQAVAEANGRALAIDLAALRWLDGAAAARLNALRAAGTALLAESAFVGRVLALHMR